MRPFAAITGWGHYVPSAVLTNQQLERMVDTSDEWILTRTGIRERRIAGPDETTSSMCLAASRRALECAGLEAGELDLVICATTTPDQPVPATSCMLQKQLGADRAWAFDLNAACSGFLTALVTGSQMIRGGTTRRVLVVGGETLSRFTNYADRETCVLFGDGAGAVVLEADENEYGVVEAIMGCSGDLDNMLTIRGGGSARPASAATVAGCEHYLAMRGREVFKHAVRQLTQVAREVLDRAGLTAADLRMVVPHQANLRILDAVRESLGLPSEKVYVNVERFGNTAAASLPIALSEFIAPDRVAVGDHLLLAAFGGGLTWGAAVVRWANVRIPAQQSEPLPLRAAG